MSHHSVNFKLIISVEPIHLTWFVNAKIVLQFSLNMNEHFICHTSLEMCSLDDHKRIFWKRSIWFAPYIAFNSCGNRDKTKKIWIDNLSAKIKMHFQGNKSKTFKNNAIRKEALRNDTNCHTKYARVVPFSIDVNRYLHHSCSTLWSSI